jgi:DNA-binding NarL/FixJ family response regulator
MADEASSPARVIIAVDHPLFREALRRLLSGRRGLELVGEAPDGADALELCRRLRPDLVLMDVRMPRMDGLTATRAIKREFPRTIVLVLTALEDSEHLLEALRAGASGYIVKDAAPKQIAESIRRVLIGESPLNQEVGRRLLMRLIEEAPKEETPEEGCASSSRRRLEEGAGPSALESLTPREFEVLRLMARGKTNQEISKELFVSVSTVKKHVRHVVSKLGVSDRVQAAVRAIELGLRPEQPQEEEWDGR